MKRKAGAGRTALITGASSGIGAALARVFAEDGFGLVLTARREDRLERLAARMRGDFGVPATVIAADLAEAAAPARIFEETERRGLVIDALVNDAGYGVPGHFRDHPWSTHAAFVQVMVTAVVHLTHLYEPKMTERRYGRILNVASLAGLLPGSPTHTLYAAAKAFLVKFSESLSLEHRDDGVLVSALCPGFTYSEFHDVVGNRALMNKLPRALWMDAESVAREGYSALMAGRVVHVPGVLNRAVASATRLVPERVALFVAGREARRTGVDPD